MTNAIRLNIKPPFSFKMSEEVLEKLGLSKNEAKVYLALLGLGASSVGKIADEARIHRTNVYDAIERLLEKGLVSYINKDDKTKVFDAASPDKLMCLIDEKKSLLESAMPTLKIRKEMTEKKSQACIYEGVAAFTRILENFLSYNEPILVYGIPKQAPELMRHFIAGFHKRRIPKKIKMTHIYNLNAEDRIKYLNSLPYTQAKYLPQELDSQVSTNICGDEVVFVVWTEPVMVIQLKNKIIAETYKRYFNVLWKAAK